MEPKAFRSPEERLLIAMREYFSRYDDANNAGEMLGRLMTLSGGALDPKWTAKFVKFLFSEDGAV